MPKVPSSLSSSLSKAPAEPRVILKIIFCISNFLFHILFIFSLFTESYINPWKGWNEHWKTVENNGSPKRIGTGKNLRRYKTKSC